MGWCEGFNENINWVSWEKVTKPKDQGGLGLTTLHALNLSLLAKWQWRFKNEEDRLWRKTLLALHKGKNEQFIPKKSNATGVWKSICSTKFFLRKVLHLKSS